MRTLGEQLDRHQGFAPGFDFLRIVLAFGVLAWHSPAFVPIDWTWTTSSGAWILNYSIVPMFFGLSGFLVAGSAQRQSLASFARGRGLRILPALIVEIVLSALVVGPIFTTLSWTGYFSDPQFFRYFLNIVGVMHYTLPGVFQENPSHQVNGSLWTVPFEIACYLVMAILISTGKVKSGKFLVVSAIGSIALDILFQGAVELFPTAPVIRHLSELYLRGGRGPALVPCFLFGAAIYALRHKLPYDHRVLLGCVAAIVAIVVFSHPEIYQSESWREFTPLMMLASPFLTYIVVHLGLTDMPRLPFFSRGDYSYGIYLYGFPLQQVLISSVPSLRTSLPLHLAASVIAATAFAAFSWHFIEKPILGLRRNFAMRARGIE